MANDDTRWTLEDLVDFEQAVASPHGQSVAAKSAAAEAARGLEGASAVRAGLRAWLEETGVRGAGKRFSAALTTVGGALAFLLFLSGISAVLGLFERARGGINVPIFLGVLLGGQWFVLLVAMLAWLLRRRAAEGFSGVQAMLGKLARKLAGARDDLWWQQIMDLGGPPREAVLWRIARLVQAGGIAFNAGIASGLAGLVMVKNVGFYWETTTQVAMQGTLQVAVGFLSAPWADIFPRAVPDGEVIAGSQYWPGISGDLTPGPEAWWQFLLLATIFWGLLPRAILWLLAWRAGNAALARMDFQSRSHRALWREITATTRVDTDERPLDGVLVLDVGGSGLGQDTLRPFLLRRLRVHPSRWLPVAVMDAGSETQAAEALAAAPAGVVLLAEGWSLSPPRMLALHTRIRASAGESVAVKFLVANVSPAAEPISPTADERREWTRFVDGLRDPAAEIYFYEPLQPVL